ncbi:hypothetical protein SAMN02745857_00301 [Andreprevotia lacus DSM 23236]|jgi:hypothetical protein|uniref:Uncharacterized protein n=1 Tax=Andreprevotia lacus DSM 23236 TaxID=1121001 RepID=A0A1W1WZV6_9NEIS|nr:hypothetical protein [Andreprevotia lacus]SMC16978.1 hypothetical protein SAMN02745857_00301 [Andreprevotia lacus DSM 23236]
MRIAHTFTPLLLAAAALPALAEVTELDAIQAQIGSTLASVDFAQKKCPDLHIDQARLQAQIKRTHKTADELRKGEDYAEQRDVLISMDSKGSKTALVCSVLPMAHGGYGRDIIE